MHEPAADQQRHRRQVGGEAREEDALVAPPVARCRPPSTRGQDRHDRLGREHHAVLGGRQAVVGAVREHRAGRREGHQRQPLQQPGPVDRADLPACEPARGAARRRLLRSWSPAASGETLAEVIADAERVRHRGQPRVHRADAREEAGVDDVEVVELVRLAVHVEHRRLGIGAEPARCRPDARPRRSPSRSSGRGCAGPGDPGASPGAPAST